MLAEMTRSPALSRKLGFSAAKWFMRRLLVGLDPPHTRSLLAMLIEKSSVKDETLVQVASGKARLSWASLGEAFLPNQVASSSCKASCG